MFDAVCYRHGFSYENNNDVFYKKIRNALRTYKALYGSMNVPVKYEIAVDDEQYPEEVQGMK
jgi:hypothetical protein